MQPAKLGALSGVSSRVPCWGCWVLAPLSHAQTALETPQQLNDRIQSLSANLRTAPHDYVIGSGDVLDIEVFDCKGTEPRSTCQPDRYDRHSLGSGALARRWTHGSARRAEDRGSA